MCGDRFPSPAPLVSRFPAAHVHDCNQLGGYGGGELKPPLVSIRLPVYGRSLLLRGSNGSILLKKSAMVYVSEKYVSEIEIFTFGRGFRTRVSRSSVQKRRFGQTDFFNRFGRLLPVMTGRSRPLAAVRGAGCMVHYLL
jgi:hypothetical protein